MRMIKAISVSIFFALAACGQAAAPGEAEAQPAASAELTASDRAAILRSQNLTADARGQVENECGEKVTPGFEHVDLGGQVGAATLLVMTGGPNSASCYGDGPGLTLLRRDGAAWRAIYSSRGAMLVVMPARGNNARDLVEGGPGFEHALFRWNGAEYAHAGSVGDGQFGEGAIYLPSN